MERLIAGYREFRARRWPAERMLYERVARGQNPECMVISCSDSRVDPATIFAARPGELFVVRNVANVVPPFEQAVSYHGTSAAIEFAVRKLKVSTILVLGHARCGGIAAACEEPDGSDMFLSAWIELLRPIVQRCPRQDGDPYPALEREGVRLSLERLMSFPFVAQAVREGRLRVEGARFGIEDGTLEWLQRDGTFVAMS